MLSSVSLRVIYICMISKEKYSVDSWRYDYRDGVGGNLDSVGNKEINLNVEEEEQRAYGISWKEWRHCMARGEIENNKEGREEAWGNVKPFKYFIYTVWEGFLVYESDNPCSFAVSKHVALVRSHPWILIFSYAKWGYGSCCLLYRFISEKLIYVQIPWEYSKAPYKCGILLFSRQWLLLTVFVLSFLLSTDWNVKGAYHFSLCNCIILALREKLLKALQDCQMGQELLRYRTEDTHYIFKDSLWYTLMIRLTLD